jgi:hypothetical protein
MGTLLLIGVTWTLGLVAIGLGMVVLAMPLTAQKTAQRGSGIRRAPDRSLVLDDASTPSRGHKPGHRVLRTS